MPKKHSMKLSYSKTINPLVLIIDAGTTNIKVFLIDEGLNILDEKVIKLKKNILQKGCVEQNPEEIFELVVTLLREIIKKNKNRLKQIIGLGITNQRETTICWDKKTTRTIYPAIVWEDKRTLKLCSVLSKKISAQKIKVKTGLNLTPYFSASKINWILKNVPTAKPLILKNRLAFGTVDSWLVFKLTGGKKHLTDYTNASRTLLFNIKTLRWDKELLSLFKISQNILPEVKSSFSFFGRLDKNIIGLDIPILAIIGDQQAGLYAAGNQLGTTKITYGTGAFILQNLGKSFYLNEHLFTTLVVGIKNRPFYAFEGKVAECGDLITPSLGNDKEMRKAIKKIAFEVNKLLHYFPRKYDKIVIDGGVSQADFLIAEQERVSQIKIQRQKSFEGTAIGTAKLIFDNKK